MDRTARVASMMWFATGMVATLLATMIVMHTWRADAAPGDSDSTFVPITPCRLVDSRQPGQSPLGPGEVRTVDAHGTNGPIAGSRCVIPTDAVGLSMNVTALDPSALTHWTIWPDGPAQPVASSLNPAPGQPPTPNAVTTPISASGRFNVFNYAGTVGILVDIDGYHTDTSLTELSERLAAVEAALAASAGPAVSARLDALENGQPFAVTARDASHSLSPTASEVVSVTVTPPVDGNVTVNSTTSAVAGTAGDDVRCTITRASEVGTTNQQVWESGGTSSGDGAQLAGTRTFSADADTPATFRLVCDHHGSGSASVSRSVLTAIFTPAA